MTFVSILLLFLLILFIYQSINTSSVVFLYGIFISAFMSYVALILYLSKFNLYYVTLTKLFNFNPGTWSYIVLQNFNPNTLLRLLNVGSILFYAFLLLFSLSFCFDKWLKNRKSRWLIYVIGTSSVLQYLFFDPGLNIAIEDFYFSEGNIDTYLSISNNGEIFFQIMNTIYLISGILLLIWQLIKYFHIRFLRNYTLFTLFSLAPLLLIYVLTFYWAPSNLVKSTFIDGFINYQQPDLTILELRLYPVLTILALLFMFYNAYKFNMIKRSNKEFNLLTHRNIDTASLGVRTFTHSIKNHLLAIQSEAEFLQERHPDDEETQYSLKLILDSCNASSRSLETASEKLSRLELSTMVTKLNIPVKAAIENLEHPNQRFTIIQHLSKKELQAHIDVELLQEAIYNILKNAKEAIHSDTGEIIITTKKINQWGVISIMDNGPGIKNEIEKHLFTPFFSTKSSITNWGVGLSYCYRIIKLHGGAIEFDSKYGKGAHFNIFIPLL